MQEKRCSLAAMKTQSMQQQQRLDIDVIISKNNQYLRVTAEDTPKVNDYIICWRHFQLYGCCPNKSCCRCVLGLTNQRAADFDSFDVFSFLEI